MHTNHRSNTSLWSQASIPEQIFHKSVFETDGETVVDLARSYAENPNTIGWRPVDDDDNNRGDVDIVSNEMQAIAEAISNSNDGYLLEAYDGTQETREELLREFETRPKINLQLTGSSGGRGASNGYSVVIADSAIGVEDSEFEDAFVRNPSEGAVDKRDYAFMGGEFGQGSLASIGVSKYGCKFIASAHKSNPQKWSWTVTRYNNSARRYEYMTIGGEIPTYTGVFMTKGLGNYTHGTLTKVYNIDSKRTPNNATNGTFLRNLAYNYPNSDFPIYIYDNRAKTKEARSVTWDGLIPDIKDCESFMPEKTKTIEVDGVGPIKLSAFIGKEDEDIPSRFLSSTDKQRAFFVVNGMTHHTMSAARVNSQFGLESINEEALFFIDCSDITTEFTNVFKSDRTQLNGRSKATTLFEAVCGAINSWSEIQEIDSDRTSIDPETFTAETQASPLSGLSVDSEGSAIQPTFETEVGESVTVDITMEGVEQYIKSADLEIDVLNVSGVVETTVDETTLTLTINPDFTSRPEFTPVVTVTDPTDGHTVKETFTVSHCSPLRDDSMAVSQKIDSLIQEYAGSSDTSVYSLMDAKQEFISWVNTHYPYKNGNQVWRSVSGDYLEEATAKVVEKNTLPEITVSKESETPECILNQLTIGELDISPDTDIVIHNTEKPLGVISCKTTLRERVGQTAFWKLASEKFDMEIPYYLVTTDQDNELSDGRKWTTVIEEFLDTAFIADTERTDYTDSIRPFEELVDEVNTL